MLVTLIAHTNDPEKTIAAAAKLCYSDAHIETLLDGLTPEKTAAFLQSQPALTVDYLTAAVTDAPDGVALTEDGIQIVQTLLR
mgnify:CR=1 FL=1